jgi:pimeloyl-ACP methyl ester carboxylesterase
VRRLLLNDVGPSVQWAAIQRIGQYLGNTGHFKTVQDAADAMWAASTTFGPHSAEQWLALSRPMVREVPGGFTLHYDPAIAVPVAQMTREMAEQGDALLWQLYDQINARTLVTRGAQSDLLTAQTAHEMTQRGPRARIVEFAGVGHAPTFVAPDQVAAATSFLLE